MYGATTGELEAVARNLAHDKQFLAGLLGDRRKVIGELLGLDPNGIALLGLCRAPRPGEHWLDDIGKIARYLGCHPGQLASYLRGDG